MIAKSVKFYFIRSMPLKVTWKVS